NESTVFRGLKAPAPSEKKECLCGMGARSIDLAGFFLDYTTPKLSAQSVSIQRRAACPADWKLNGHRGPCCNHAAYPKEEREHVKDDGSIQNGAVDGDAGWNALERAPTLNGRGAVRQRFHR